jgi:hypothetical protein
VKDILSQLTISLLKSRYFVEHHIGGGSTDGFVGPHVGPVEGFTKVAIFPFPV